MPQVPFPHVLSSDMEIKKGILRVVSDEEMKGGASITEIRSAQMNKKTGNMERVHYCYTFKEVTEIRPARGTWNNRPVHPTYYSGVGSLILKFESELNK